VRRHRRVDGCGDVDQRVDETLLSARFDWHVQEQERCAKEWLVAYGCRGGFQEPTAIGAARRVEFLLHPRQQVGQIRADGFRSSDGVRGDACQSQVGDRVRERAREPRCARDAREVRERPCVGRLERGPSRNGFSSKRGTRRNPAPSQSRRRDSPGELGQAESREAERGATFASNAPRQIVGGATRRSDDGDRLMSRKLSKETSGSIESHRRRRRLDDQKGTRPIHRIQPAPGAVPGIRNDDPTPSCRRTVSQRDAAPTFMVGDRADVLRQRTHQAASPALFIVMGAPTRDP
jgi:hypothetical protein